MRKTSKIGKTNKMDNMIKASKESKKRKLNGKMKNTQINQIEAKG
jgi:hypothetical protein